MSLRLLIFEPSASGHRMVLYLRNIVREAVRRRWALHIVTTDSALDHPAYRLLTKEYGDHFTISTMPAVDFPSGALSTPNLLRQQLQRFNAFAKAYRAIRHGVKPDVIYVNHLAYCDKVMAIVGSPFGETPVVGMLMGLKFHHRRMGIIGPGSRNDWCYEKLFARLLRVSELASVLVIDPLLVPYMEQRSRKGADKITYVPDVAHLSGSLTRERARRALAIEDHTIVVLVYGSLNERKGIDRLVAALHYLGDDANAVVALIAGEPQDSITRELLAGKEVGELMESKMLRVIAGFLDDERELMVFKAADLVWLSYQDFYGMSGVLLQAGLASLPVLACRQGLIGWLVKRYGLGETLDSMDPATIGSTIRQLANDPQARRCYGERGLALAMTHTPQRLAEGVCDAIYRAAMPIESFARSDVSLF